MATVHNPSATSLFCVALHDCIDAGATVEVSDEVAAKVSRNIFVVTEDKPAAPEPPPVVRKTVTRGGQPQVEVSEAPVHEERG
jgi:hypothetical protein